MKKLKSLRILESDNKMVNKQNSKKKEVKELAFNRDEARSELNIKVDGGKKVERKRDNKGSDVQNE